MTDSFSVENMGATIGDIVLVKGLTKANHLNGRQGVVSSDLSRDGSLSVNLFIPCDDGSERKEVALKPSHLVSVGKVQDGPIPTERQRYSCENCGKDCKPSDLKDCSKCLLVSYCSKECQRQNWKKEHKHECELFRQERKSRGANSNQLDGQERQRVLLRVAGRLHNKGKDSEAETLLRQGIKEMSPMGYVELYRNLATLVQCQGRVDEAVEITKEAEGVLEASILYNDREKEKGRIDLYRNLVYMLDNQGDYEQAIKMGEEALKLDKTAIDVLPRIAYMHRCRGFLDKAEELYYKFLKEAGDDIENLKGKWCIDAIDTYLGLSSVFKRRIKQSFHDGRLSLQPVPVDYIQQQSREGIAVMQKVILLDPTYEETGKFKISEYQMLMKMAEDLNKDLRLAMGNAALDVC